MYECYASMYVCTLHVCSASGGQKRTSDPLELELQMFVSCHVGAGNEIWFICKGSQCS